MTLGLPWGMRRAAWAVAGVAVAVVLAFAARPARAAEVQVAVAANVLAPMQRIAADFQRASGHRAVLTPGSTGKFHAQLRHGAPFDVLLAADQATPRALEAEGHAVPGSRATYATGRLVLWSRKPGVVDERGDVLKAGAFTRLAVADPKLAPYGAAAMQVLDQLALRAALAPKLVYGDSIAQAQQFVATGNADIGFIARSQVWRDGVLSEGSAWLVPATLHAPIRQDLVILKRGRDNPAAAALAAFMRSDEALGVLRAFGYEP